MSKNTTHTIRIVDKRQTKRPRLWHQLLFTFLMPLLLFGPGIAAGSPAMQWAGFVILLIFISVAFLSWLDDFMTIEEARQKLDQLEAGEGQ